MTDHVWRPAGIGESARYECKRCGAVEHVFHEVHTPSGVKSRPMTAAPSCEEETVRYVIEE